MRSVNTKAGICYLTMPLPIRRARGALLRLARHRPAAAAAGIALAAPAAWIEFSGRYDAWWVEGLSLILLGTGIALIWIGCAGNGPDWVDPEP
jgi:hypothetical protein